MRLLINERRGALYSGFWGNTDNSVEVKWLIPYFYHLAISMLSRSGYLYVLTGLLMQKCNSIWCIIAQRAHRPKIPKDVSS